MAHDNNGHIYIDTNTTPHTGISVAEVASVLGAQAGEELCGHANIKKWAKFKPMAIGDMHGYTDAQAKLANYGLLVPFYTSFDGMIADIKDNTWSNRSVNYEQGKEAWQNNGLAAGSWHRLLDFNNYLHSAVSIMAQLTLSKASYTAGERPVFYTNAGGSSDYNLRPANIRYISGGAISAENMWLGIYMENSAGEFFKTISRCWDAVHGTIQISDDDFIFRREDSTDNIRACMFLSRDNLNNGDVVHIATNASTGITGQFIPLMMSRAIISAYFAEPKLNFAYDPNYWFALTGDGQNVIFAAKSVPDSSYSWNLSVVGEYTDSQSRQQLVLSCPSIEVPLYQEYDDMAEVWLDLYLRFETDQAHSQVKFDLYACDSSVSYADILDGASSIGSPILSRTLTITEGELLTDPTAINRIERFTINARLTGNSHTQYIVLTD